MNLEELRALLADNGYTGEMTVDAISAWAATNGVTLAGNWQSLFEGDESDKAKADAKPDDKPKTLDLSGIVAKARVSKLEAENARLKAVRDAAIRVGEDRRDPINLGAAGEAYDARAAKGQTRFRKAWHAAAFVAGLRFYSGSGEYSRRAEDEKIVKSLETTTGPNGGYLVAPEIAEGIIYNTDNVGTARRLANVERMTASEKMARCRINNVQFSPLGEGATSPVVNANYGLISLKAKTAGATIPYTREMFNDAAVNVADEIASILGEAAEDRFDRDFITGDGSASSNGIVGLANAATTIVTPVNASGNSWAGIVRDDLLNLMATPRYFDATRAAFLGSRQLFLTTFMRIAYGTARAQTDAPIAEIRGDSYFLMGVPYIVDDRYMPRASASAQRCLYYGDFIGGSMIGVRDELEVNTDPYTLMGRRITNVHGFISFDVNIHGHLRTGETNGPIAVLRTT